MKENKKITIFIVLFLPFLLSMGRLGKETHRMSPVEFSPRDTFNSKAFIAPQLMSFWDCNESMQDTSGERQKFSGYCRGFLDVRYGLVLDQKHAVSISGMFGIFPYRVNTSTLIFENPKFALSVGTTIEYLWKQFGYGGNLALEYNINSSVDLFITTGYRSYKYKSFVSNGSSQGSRFENDVQVRQDLFDASFGAIFSTLIPVFYIFELGLHKPISSKVIKEDAPSKYSAGSESSYRLSCMILF